jgi:hypothetical protein
VYVYVRNSDGVWGQLSKLTPNDSPPLALFGGALAIDNDTLVVGARGDASRRGSAYVFARGPDGAWTQEKKLSAGDGDAGDLFGYSVAIDGSTIIVGAESDSDVGRVSGSAYVFVRNDSGTWVEQAKLTASDLIALEHFGGAVALDGDSAVIGAYGDDDLGRDSGSAYVFVRDSTGQWTEEAKLLASDGQVFDAFGQAVAFGAGRILIGAPSEEDNPGGNSGSVYCFARNDKGDWAEEAKLSASDAEPGDMFGENLALEHEELVIGAPLDDDNGPDSGAAYIFSEVETCAWAERGKLLPSDGAEYDMFGESSASNSGSIIIGSLFDESDETGYGSAYAFESRRAFEIDIDIKPGNERNVINARSRGRLWVAILSDSEFDALQVDPETVAFGPGGASPDRYTVKDVNRDRLSDLMLRFRTPEVGLQCGDTEMELTGETYAGDSIIGTDAVKIVRCKKPKKRKKK